LIDVGVARDHNTVNGNPATGIHQYGIADFQGVGVDFRHGIAPSHRHRAW
jgi:hypothetical protein